MIWLELRMNDDNAIKEKDSTGLLNESPLPNEKHLVNYLSYLGDIFRRFRRNLPKDRRSATSFGKHLAQYTGHPVDRNRIARAESGDSKVYFEVFASYFDEMGVWPEIIKVLDQGHEQGLRYFLLVEKELSDKIAEAKNTGDNNLTARADKEKE